MKHIYSNVAVLFVACTHSFLFSIPRSVLIGDNYSEYIAKEVHDLGPAATIMLDQYVFTFDPIRETLAQEVAEGAYVSINMYRAHFSNPSTYYFFEDVIKLLPHHARKRLQLNKYPGKYTLHAKHLSWREHGHCACHLGSHNLTNLASEANKELMVATYDDFEIFEQCKTFHDTIAHLCSQVYDQNKDYIKSLERVVIDAIPEHRMVMTSLKYDINGSLITFVNALQEGGVALVGSYSINDIKIIQALCDAADRGACITFFIDGQTIDTKTEVRLLKKLHEHGVVIFVYNYDGSKRYKGYACKMHAKFYAAKQVNQPTIVIIPTRNFTKQFGLNMASVHPNDEALFDSLYIWCQKLELECDAYENLAIN